MPIRVEHIIEKGVGALNEDSLLMEGNIFGVFDGATSLNAELFEKGKTGGALASAIAAQTFSRNHQPLTELAKEANEAIRTQMEHNRVDCSNRDSLWCVSAAAVRVEEQHIEWFQSGDAHIVFMHPDKTFSLAFHRPDHDCETLQLIKQLGRSHPDVTDKITSVRLNMNRDYGVLNGEDEAMDFFRSGSVPKDKVEAVLLFTDGLHIPCATPNPMPDFTSLVAMVRTKGLAGLRSHVRCMEKSDPDIQLFPRFKCHDDLAGIALYFNDSLPEQDATACS